MLDKRGRDIGEPVVEVFYDPATPESVARNRENLDRTLSQIFTEFYGRPTRMRVLWPETKPSWYGKHRIGLPKKE